VSTTKSHGCTGLAMPTGSRRILRRDLVAARVVLCCGNDLAAWQRAEHHPHSRQLATEEWSVGHFARIETATPRRQGTRKYSHH